MEHCFTSPPTQYRLYRRRFLQVKRPNQQYQSTEGEGCKRKQHKKHKENSNANSKAECDQLNLAHKTRQTDRQTDRERQWERNREVPPGSTWPQSWSVSDVRLLPLLTLTTLWLNPCIDSTPRPDALLPSRHGLQAQRHTTIHKDTEAYTDRRNTRTTYWLNTSAATAELSRQLMFIVKCHCRVYSSFSIRNSAVHRHHRT